MCAWNTADMTNVRKFRKSLDVSKDTSNDVRCRNRVPALDVGMNGGNVRERFEREAHAHVLDFFLRAETSALVARRVVPSRSAPRIRRTSATWSGRNWYCRSSLEI